MPQRDVGRVTPTRKVKRRPVYGPPAPKPQPKPVTVAPADRVGERTEARRVQVQKSKSVSPDRQDTKRPPAQQKRDAAVVAANVKVSRARAASRQKSIDDPGPVQLLPKYAKARAASKAQVAGRVAPVLKVLDQTTRPLHAVAAGTDAAVQGRNVPKAALKGLKNEDKTTFSTVLKHAGVKNKYVRGGAGFVLDVGLDPTTYLTGGTGSVVRKAATGAAAKEATGVTVKLAGKEIPGVRKATAKAGEGGGKVFRKAVPEKVRNATRDAASEVNPNIAPAGVDKATHEAGRRIARKARASTNRGDREAINLSHGVKSQIGEKNYNRVVDAAEADNLTSLPPDLRKHAETVRGHLAEVLRKQRAVGLKVGEVKNRPQIAVPTVTADTAKSASAVGKARRSEASARRAVKSAETRHGVYQGRAEVLSRSVGGVTAEKAAERGRNVAHATRVAKVAARTERRALAKGLSPAQAKSAANRVADAMRSPKYAAGGKGVRDTASEVRAAETRLADAEIARAAAEGSHATTLAEAASQRKVKRRVEKINAKRAAAVKGYIPRKLTPDAAKADAKKAARGTAASPISSKARKEQRSMAELRTAQPGRYRQDLHAVLAERMAEGTASVARATLAKELADLGRQIPRGPKPHLAGHEAVYKLKDGKLTEVDPSSAAFRKPVRKGAAPKAKYVVLNRKVYDRTMGTAQGPRGGTIMHGYDKTQSGFKRVALATPGFHIRNAIGDTAQAYVHQPGQKLAGNMVRAGRVLKAAGRIENAQRGLGTTVKAGKGTLKTKHYGKISYEEAAQKLIDVGAARSGYTSRELRELATSGDKKLKLPKSPAGVRRAFLNREDLPRLATAIHALREGATYEEAAARVAGAHFDYADLTPFERDVARRIMPFYTWTARNVPLQSKRLLTNPGKYAAFQKVRENAAQLANPGAQDPQTRDLYKQLEAAGVKMTGGWEKYLTSYEQRNAGVPVSWKGHKFTISAGLPLSDLNELPGMSGPGEYLNKAASLVTPIIKDPVEFGFNYSFFFRDQIERDNSPLVAAPSPVGKWPEWAKKKFGVVKAQDKRSGKMIWQWPGKADYVAHAVPGLPSTVVKMMTPGHDQQGKGTAQKALGVAGVKATPVDATTNAINLAYARGQEIQKRQAVLRKQQNPANGVLIGAKNPTPEYTRLALQLRTVNRIAYQGKSQRKDAVLPKQGGPPKVRASVGRVQVPGVGARVRLPGAGGRVKVP